VLPPSARLIGAQLSRYIQDELFWVLHAPRQTGKTTFLQNWMREINASDKAIACYVSVERCQEFPRAEDAIPAICESIQRYAGSFLEKKYVPDFPNDTYVSQLDVILKKWAQIVAPKPLVVLFDEVDVLHDQALVSFLRQLRGGFAARGIGKFPVSVALAGLHDVKDYKVQSKDNISWNPGSPFNIKHDSVLLGNFSRDDVQTLIEQYVIDTGQIFEKGAVNLIYDVSRGQPWLINVLLQHIVSNILNEETRETVTVKHVQIAKEMLIQQRVVPLDSLAERLKEQPVKSVIQTILTGDMRPDLLTGDNFSFACDLGLVTLDHGTPSMANPIYKEVVARVLSEEYQLSIPAPEFQWKKDDGSLDMDALFKEFQRFWRRHSDTWELKADYTEAFPHLLVMAFLQRVINTSTGSVQCGGGRIEREYAAVRGRFDLAVLYNGVWSIIEIKLVHPAVGVAGTKEEGLQQISRYRDTIDPNCEAYLVLFDRTPAGRKKNWDKRITWETIPQNNKKSITVVGC